MTVWTVPAQVTRVVDGDTLIMDLDLGWHIWRVGERCRLEKINTPELTGEDAAAGWAAREYAARQIAASAPGTDLRTDSWTLWPPVMVTFVSTGLDKYGRPLGAVRLADGRWLGDMLLDSGHARAA